MLTRFQKGHIPTNKGKKGLRVAWNKNKKGWTIGTNAGFQKGHPLYNNKLAEWREKGGVSWNKGIRGICKPNSGSFKKGHISWIKDKHHTEESIKKMIKNSGMRGKYHTEEWKKQRREFNKINGIKPPVNIKRGFKHSEESKNKNKKWHINNPNRKFKDTSIELKIEAELKRRNINYQKQIPLCNVAIVDFYLPEYRIVIQADGDYWHNRQGAKEKDEKQNKVLIFNGFNVYRFWEHEINESVEKCIDKIISGFQ